MTRRERRRRGQTIHRQLGLDAEAGPEALPGFADFMAEVAFAGIWDRPGLSRPDRMLCTLAVLGLLQRLQHLERYVAAALDLELPARSILEVFMQAGLYGGFVTTETAAPIACRVFARRGVVVPHEPERGDSDATLDQRGEALMATLHGARGRAGYAAPGNAITATLYSSAVRYGYGELWFRPGLDHRQRMLIAVASFTALGLESQLEKFAQSALNVGLAHEEIVEAIVQTGPYSGFPRALNGLAIASRVLPPK